MRLRFCLEQTLSVAESEYANLQYANLHTPPCVATSAATMCAFLILLLSPQGHACDHSLHEQIHLCPGGQIVFFGGCVDMVPATDIALCNVHVDIKLHTRSQYVHQLITLKLKRSVRLDTMFEFHTCIEPCVPPVCRCILAWHCSSHVHACNRAHLASLR